MTKQFQFTYLHLFNGIAGLVIVFVFSTIFPSIIDCTKTKYDVCPIFNQIIPIGSILGILLIIFGGIVPYFLSIKPRSERDQIEDDLDSLRGPTHGTLPKKGGYNEVEK